MTKTSVYLPDQLKHDLALVARRRGRSEAELIREAIARLVAEEEHERPRPRPGLFASGDPTLAERVDEALAGGFGADGVSW
jgi:Arc/MetJ-type ribon-helix-helix transcriptional regulator